jgi:hypothetical protein
MCRGGERDGAIPAPFQGCAEQTDRLPRASARAISRPALRAEHSKVKWGYPGFGPGHIPPGPSGRTLQGEMEISGLRPGPYPARPFGPNGGGCTCGGGTIMQRTAAPPTATGTIPQTRTTTTDSGWLFLAALFQCGMRGEGSPGGRRERGKLRVQSSGWDSARESVSTKPAR